MPSLLDPLPVASPLGDREGDFFRAPLYPGPGGEFSEPSMSQVISHLGPSWSFDFLWRVCDNHVERVRERVRAR